MTDPNRPTLKTSLRAALSPTLARRFATVVLLPALAFYCLSLLLLSLAGFTTLEVLRDPAQQTDTSSLLGFLSSIGSWLWVAAATICFFRLAHPGPAPDPGYRGLVKSLGIFSLVLALDDFFLIHDRFIAEGLVFPLYAIFIIWLLMRNHARIARIDGLSFLLAGGFLAMSILVDALQDLMPLYYLSTQVVEEGFKFLGGAAWLYFCNRVAATPPDESPRMTP